MWWATLIVIDLDLWLISFLGSFTCQNVLRYETSVNKVYTCISKWPWFPFQMPSEGTITSYTYALSLMWQWHERGSRSRPPVTKRRSTRFLCLWLKFPMLMPSAWCGNGTRRARGHDLAVTKRRNNRFLCLELKGILSKLTTKFWICQKCGKMKDYN
jgi:hypothetical protein